MANENSPLGLLKRDWRLAMALQKKMANILTLVMLVLIGLLVLAGLIQVLLA